MNLVSANRIVPCPRCSPPVHYLGQPIGNCFLCDGRKYVSSALAAAYNLIVDPTLPKPNGYEVEQLRKDLGE